MDPTIDSLTFLGHDERAHLKVIAGELRSQNAILFAGAGVSFNARCGDGSDRQMPSWYDLVEALAGDLEGVSPHDNALKIADLYESAFGRARLIERLTELIPDREYAPGDVHKLLPLMGFKEVITTNFDTLIERAFRQKNIEPKVVVSGKDLVHRAWPRVIKANGCFEHNPIDVVITGEDFRKYEADHPLLVSFLTHVFVESLVLFAGFSLDDPAFRSIFGRCRDLLGRDGRVAYSIQGWMPPSQITFWAARGLRIISLYSGVDAPELSYSARLQRLMEVLLAEARTELTLVRSQADHLSARLTGEPLRAARKALHGGDVRGAWGTALKHTRDEPGLLLGCLLPPACLGRLGNSRKVFDHELAASQGPLNLAHERGLDARDEAAVRTIFASLKGSVQWVRQVTSLLGAIIDQRGEPGRSPAGLFGVPWARGLIGLLADSLLPDAGPDAAVPQWVPDVPVLINHVRLLSWLEHPTAEARRRFAEASPLIDVRCLAAESASRQREAAMHLMLHGASADLDLVGGLLRRSTDQARLTRRLSRRRHVWTALPAISDAQGRLTRAASLRIHDLPPDIRFRVETFASSANDHAQDFLEVLDWLRLRLHDQDTTRIDGATLDLVYRHHHLYLDFDALDAVQQREAQTPFHSKVRAHNAAIIERAERLTPMPPRSAGGARVLSHLRTVIRAIERGKALHRESPLALDLAWDAASDALSTDGTNGVPWNLLVMLAIQADGAKLEKRRGAPLIEGLRRRLFDLPFMVEGGLRRLAGGAFAQLAWLDLDGHRVDDAGLHTTLLGMATCLNLAAQHTPWDPSARPDDAALLSSLTELVTELLCTHYVHGNLRDNLISALAALSRVAPVPVLLKAAHRWISTCAQKSPNGRMGLNDLDWARLLADDAETLEAATLTVLLGRGMQGRHRAQGIDLIDWLLTLYRLDAQRRSRHATLLSDTLRAQIEGSVRDVLDDARRPDGFAWLNLAAKIRLAGVPLDVRAVEAGLSELRTSDPADARALGRRFDWHRRPEIYLPPLAVFAGDLSDETLGFVLGHFGNEPSTETREATPEAIATWSPKRRDAVAAFLVDLVLARPDRSPAIAPVLRHLINAGATAHGHVGAALHTLDDPHRTALWANFAAAFTGPKHEATGAADAAIRCLREAGEPLPTLESLLIHTLPTEAAVDWLATRLTDTAFRARHDGLLTLLHRRLLPADLAQDSPATRRLRAQLTR
jgi:hypothetical protein